MQKFFIFLIALKKERKRAEKERRNKEGIEGKKKVNELVRTSALQKKKIKSRRIKEGKKECEKRKNREERQEKGEKNENELVPTSAFSKQRIWKEEGLKKEEKMEKKKKKRKRKIKGE